MKITSAKVIVCAPSRNFVTLKIETDEGLTGIGDAGGLPALGPVLAEALAGDRFREAERLQLGPDAAVTYERNRT